MFRRPLAHLLVSLALLAAALVPALPAEAGWRSLTGPLPSYTTVDNYAISPDSAWVVFIADIDVDGVKELYSVPITGGSRVKLNPNLSAGQEVNRFSFSNNGQYVYYLSDQEVENRLELWRVPVGGGDPLKISAALAAGGNVGSFLIASDTGRIVYMADQEVNDRYEIFGVAGNGGAVVKLNGTLVDGGDVGIFRLDVSSDRVVYTAQQDTVGRYELYSAPMTGGSFVKLNPPIVSGGANSGLYSDFDVDPALPLVIFIAHEAAQPRGRLYSTPTAAACCDFLTQLNFELTGMQRLLNFRISPLGDRVVYNVGTNTVSDNAVAGNLYSNLVGAGGAADVTEHADPLYGVAYTGFQFTPDGGHVVYNFQKDGASPNRLETATPLGVRQTLYTPGVSEPVAGLIRFSPDGDWVAYAVDDDLHLAPAGGGSSIHFNQTSYAGFTTDSGRLLFTRQTGPDGLRDLFSEQVFGGARRDLSGTYGTGYVSDVKVSADNQWMVFNAYQYGHYELRVSDGVGMQPPVFLPQMVR